MRKLRRESNASPRHVCMKHANRVQWSEWSGMFFTQSLCATGVAVVLDYNMHKDVCPRHH